MRRPKFHAPKFQVVDPVVRKLVQFASDSDMEAQSILDRIASGHVPERTTDVDDAMRIFGLERWQTVAFFKSLAEIGCGRFIVGRKGHPSRFEWTYEPLSVAEAALGRRQDVTPLVAETSDEEEDTGENESVEAEEDVDEHVVNDDPKSPSPSAHIVDHSYALRPDFTVRLRLPVTLKRGEAERLAAFIRTLPFEQGD